MSLTVDAGVKFLWRIPWADAIAEDQALQEKAAERLRTYLLDGRTDGVKVVAAEVVKVNGVPDSPFALEVHIEIPLKIGE